jgi:hypothetical protein
MEQSYWIGRKRESAAMARGAASAEARLIHLHLAGCYSVKAAMAAAPIPLFAPPPEPAPPQLGRLAPGEPE